MQKRSADVPDKHFDSCSVNKYLTGILINNLPNQKELLAKIIEVLLNLRIFGLNNPVKVLFAILVIHVFQNLYCETSQIRSARCDFGYLYQK